MCLKVKQLNAYFPYYYNEDMNLKITVILKINLDPVMLILLTLKNMEFVTTEVAEGLCERNCFSCCSGAIAKKVLKQFIGSKFSIIGGVTQIGPVFINRDNWNDSQLEKTRFFVQIKKLFLCLKNTYWTQEKEEVPAVQ